MRSEVAKRLLNKYHVKMQQLTLFEKTIIVVDRILHATTIGIAAYFINQLIGKL